MRAIDDRTTKLIEDIEDMKNILGCEILLDDLIEAMSFDDVELYIEHVKKMRGF